MKQLLLTALFFSLTFLSNAQNPADTVDYSKEKTQVQIPPVFPGGKDVWIKYLEKGGLKVGVDSTNGETAIVSFLVGRDGTVSEVVVRNEDKINKRLAKKVKDFITKGPAWMPAVYYGRNAIARKMVLISW